MVIDYREAFDEWLKLDPLNNPSATPGPPYMPGYKNPNLEERPNNSTQRPKSCSRREQRQARWPGSTYVKRCCSLSSYS
jgi:hypothetical protein